MDEILTELTRITANAKKKINQPYSKETVENKKKEIEYLENKYKQHLIATNQNTEKLLSEFKNLKEEAISTLTTHIDKRNLETVVKMTTLDLNDIATLSKLIPIFNGRREDLHTFITTLKLVHGTIETGKRQSFFSFVFDTRLELKVQNRVKQNSTPTTIENLIIALNTNYSPAKSANSILNELIKVTQRNGNLSSFAAKIESLVTDLNEVQITEEGECNRSSIVSTNSRIAFNSFMNGLTDPQILATIDASQVRTFSEALRIAEKVDSRVQQRQVMYHSARNGQNRSSECTKCGRTHGDRCPAQGQNCNKCGRPNHFSNKCYTRNNNNYNNIKNRNNNNSGNNRHNNYRNNINNKDKNRKNNCNNNNNGNNSYRSRNGRTRNINYVQNQENYQNPEVRRSGTPEDNY